MKKNWFLIITSIIIYGVIIFSSNMYVITPGINKLKEADSIKELSFDEKTKMIDEINEKYINLEKETNNKFDPDIKKINEEFANKEKEIKDKYDKLEVSIEEKYDVEEKKLNNLINNNKVAQNNEFFANGLSKKYYELSDKGLELTKQKNELSSDEREEIRNNEKLENNELREAENNKNSQINTIENNKKLELKRLNEKKQNELNKINNQNTNKYDVKKEGIIKIVLGLIIILIPILYIILIFNKLTRLSNSVEEKWSQIDVLLKQRSDLIPNIVETVKGYSKHEKSTLAEVTKARNQVINASTKEEEIKYNENLSTAITKLLFLEESYPELKSNTNFMNLQNNLKEIEINISINRQQYNKAVLKYQNKLETFPSNIVSSIFNFKPELFFEIDESDKENPKITI